MRQRLKRAGWEAIVALMLSLGCPALAQPLTPALVQSAWQANGNLILPVCTASFASNNAAGNLIIVAVTIGALSFQAHPVIADTQGNAYYPATGQMDWQTRGGGGSSQLFYAPNVKTGPNTVTVTEVGEFNGAGNAFNQIAIYEYSGLALAGPLDAAAAQFGITSTNSLEVTSGLATTRTGGDLVFGFGTIDSGRLSPGDGFTGRPNPLGLAEDLLQPVAGPVQATATDNTANDLYVMLMAAFRPGSGLPGPVLPVPLDQTLPAQATLLVTNTAAELNTNLLAAQSILFSYTNREALLADGWSFLATNPDGTPRNTEITNSADAALVSYDQAAHPGALRIPCDVGNLFGPTNTSRNSLFRTLDSNWVSLRLALTFLPQTNFQQANLALYQDDDNYVEVGMMSDNRVLTGLAGVWVTAEIAGHDRSSIVDLRALSQGLVVSNVWLRLDRDAGTGVISGFCSLDALAWQYVGAFSQSLLQPRLGLWVGGSLVPYTNGSPACDLRQLDVLTWPPAPALTYQLLNPPAGAAIDGNGIITWSPNPSQSPATNLFTTVVTDDQVPPLSATNGFTVSLIATSAPPLLSITLSNSLAQLSWTAVAGLTYRLQFQNALSGTNWQALAPDIVATGTNASVTLPPADVPAQFYRLLVVP